MDAVSDNFEQVYQFILERLKNDERTHIVLSEELKNQIQTRWGMVLEQKRFNDLGPIMCILDHSRHPCGALEELFFQTLELSLPASQIVFTLSASWKHLLERWAKNGDRVPMRYLEIMRSLLQHPEAEVREWTLRTLDQVGPQGRMLHQEVKAAKVGWFHRLNPHRKNINQLIDMFEKRWAQK
jgi:hypothetical protein